MPLIRKPDDDADEAPVGKRGNGSIPGALASLGRRREARAGCRFFRQDAEADRCFFLERGEVALRRITRKGSEMEIARIGAGEWFAEAVLFAGRRYPADAVAVVDCEVLEFRRSDILVASDPRTSSAAAASVEASAEAAAFFLSLLARKCLALNGRIDQLTAMDARERVATFVLGLCPGRNPGRPGAAKGCEVSRKSCSLALPKKKREIASELGMSPETFSRALKRMEEEGYLKIDGPRVEIPSCERLRSLAEEG